MVEVATASPMRRHGQALAVAGTAPWCPPLRSTRLEHVFQGINRRRRADNHYTAASGSNRLGVANRPGRLPNSGGKRAMVCVRPPRRSASSTVFDRRQPFATRLLMAALTEDDASLPPYVLTTTAGVIGWATAVRWSTSGRLRAIRSRRSTWRPTRLTPQPRIRSSPTAQGDERWRSGSRRRG